MLHQLLPQHLKHHQVVAVAVVAERQSKLLSTSKLLIQQIKQRSMASLCVLKFIHEH
jgi:hypothetical protein